MIQEQEGLNAELLSVCGKVEHDLSVARERLRLNIGGSKFETTVHTLTKHADTYFSAAFSGRHVPLDSEGYYFIDRDSKHFGAILSFLRTGKLRLPRDEEDREELMVEVRHCAPL